MAKKTEEVKTEATAPAITQDEVKAEATAPAITQDEVKATVYKLLIAKASDMLKGPDRVNDPHTMEAMATLYNAIK